MILTVFHGFCMALVDSVPGVSGGTLASIPFIAAAERTALKRLRGALFALLDMAVVVLTLLRGSSALGSVSFASLSPLSLLYIFLSSAVAITAMVLPGILGSSILLIAGVYLPAIQAVRSFLHMELSVLPGLFALGFGVLAGVALSIHAIRTALHKYRSEMVWLILGLTLGSLYAIVYGAVNLTVPLPPMSLVTFDAPAFLLGVAILLGLELLRGRMEAGLAAGKERIAHEHGLEHPALGPGRSDLPVFGLPHAEAHAAQQRRGGLAAGGRRTAVYKKISPAGASSARRSGGQRAGGQRMPEEPHRPPAPLLAGQQRAAAHR